MKITLELTDAAVLRELAGRLERRRIDANLTQSELAERAGISKRSVERMEAGRSTDFALLIRTLRALRLFDELDRLVPDLPQSPMTLLKQRGHERKRVGRPRPGAKPRAGRSPSRPWKWEE